jgi:exodeoxyribonuclease III
MKILSWNVNGIRAIHEKGFKKWFLQEEPDILCLQEIKADEDQIPEELKKVFGYLVYFNPAQKKGYSGTAIYTKIKPEKVSTKIGFKQFDEEGRFIRLDFRDFILINFYIPNGGQNKENLDYKLKFYDYLIKYLRKIKNKPIILAGDFNVAHQEIDLARPKENQDSIMFTPKERQQIDKILDLGFIDTFRQFYKEGGSYSWWAYYSFGRQKGLGWRIDYFFVSQSLEKKLKKALILNKVMGSDHCPVGIDIF